MKNLFILLLMLGGFLFATDISAQMQTPAPSPLAELSQKVGLTDVTIVYSRPSAKDRDVFGTLVPYGNVWRTGANAATTIEFSDNVVVMGKELKAGKYSLYSTPNKDKWTIYLNSNWRKWGQTEADEGETLVSFEVASYSVKPAVESFTIGIDDLRNNDASIVISWATTAVKIPFAVPTVEKATASIERVMAGPSARDYYSAAGYYLAEGKDPKQALEWVNKSIDDNNPMYYMVYTRALIYKELNDKDGVVKNATLARDLAEKAGDNHYLRMSKDLLKEFGSK